MKKNKIATLNLTKSLDDFKESVTKFLELSEIEDWDGKFLLETEQRIREAALIKALRELGENSSGNVS